jgi:DNA polymerase-1
MPGSARRDAPAGSSGGAAGVTPRLGLIDGSALAYRSYFAFIRSPLMSSRGENTSAPYGFANTVLKILREDRPDYLVIAFDTSAPTFRHEIYEEYKSTRLKMPDELADSLPAIHELVAALRIPVLRQDGIEADDLIGTLALAGERAGMNVVIYSGDKDFCQLVTDRVRILRPKGGGDDVLIGPAGVVEWMGVPPERIVDLLALMGDTSDHVPGVPGIGEKTALKLLAEHETLEAVLDHSVSIPGKLGERLRENRASAELSRRLVTIRTDVPIELDWARFRPGEPDRSALVSLFRHLEFKRLIDQFALEPEKPSATIRCLSSLDEVAAALPRWRAATRLGLAITPSPRSFLDADLVGLAVSAAPGEASYLPLAHEVLLGSEDPNLPLAGVLDAVRPLLENPDLPKVAHDVKTLSGVLLGHGITLRGAGNDPMLAAYLLDPGQAGYSIEALALAELDVRMVSVEELTGSGKERRELWQLDAGRVKEHVGAAAELVLRLNDRYRLRLTEHALLDLYEEVELPLASVILGMERRGILLDPELFSRMGRELSSEMARLEGELHACAGRAFNVNSTLQLRSILFDELRLPRGRTGKSGPSTDSDVLEKLADLHPLPRLILEYRLAAKLLTTYVEALPRLVRADTGRVHTSFHQAVTATGRLSSSDPNLQNIPIRTEAGRRIREGFIAQPGWRLLSADYSQVELRVLASICGDANLIEAFETGIDVHRHTASKLFSVELDEVTPDMRARAKAVNFGVIYGQGPRGLSEVLKIPPKMAKEFIDSYFERYAAVRGFKEDVLGRARKDGYVTTLLGRRRYVPEIHSDQHQRRAYAERTAVNTVIQGTAADLIKIAMVRIARGLHAQRLRSAMLLTVHDELVFEAPPEEETRLETIVREEMAGALELRVPLVVDSGWGRNWLEAH